MKRIKANAGSCQPDPLGIGAIIGSGLFVHTAAAPARPPVLLLPFSFIIAAVGCAFAGLCYAEFASMIPVAGSAYAYSYVTMGEIVAWIIGWALIMEYALGAATVGIVWSEYLNRLLGGDSIRVVVSLSVRKYRLGRSFPSGYYQCTSINILCC